MDPLKMYFLLNMEIFHCYVRLTEGKYTSPMDSIGMDSVNVKIMG